ncbi:MAG: hypothetical protein JWR84_3080 [Caulobacter sp.]|nr:hypothetical protein [Caulobacter sp.]
MSQAAETAVEAVIEPPVLLTELRGRVLLITLNRPDRFNALSAELHEALLAALQAAARNDAVGAVVLTGAGRGFCSGGDLGSNREGTTQESRADTLVRHSGTAKLLHSMPKPTIAMINGAAAGAGLTFALACDLRYVARPAALTTAYAKVGLSGDYGVSYFLTRLVGPAKARELMFFSDKLTAEQALTLGLVNGVEDPENLEAAVMALAQRLADGPAVALRYMKQNLILAESGAALDPVLEREAFNMARCGRTEDAAEAGAAFREKRPPVFKGR